MFCIGILYNYFAIISLLEIITSLDHHRNVNALLNWKIKLYGYNLEFLSTGSCLIIYIISIFDMMVPVMTISITAVYILKMCLNMKTLVFISFFFVCMKSLLIIHFQNLKSSIPVYWLFLFWLHPKELELKLQIMLVSPNFWLIKLWESNWRMCLELHLCRIKFTSICRFQ